MYITYQTRQYRQERDCYCSGPYDHPIAHPKEDHPCFEEPGPSNFKPTWLIRISDMEVIPGSNVEEPYYVLSYSWSQSGDIFNNGDGQKYTRHDNGEHKIISYRRKNKTKKNSRGKAFVKHIRLVKFEGLIQKICQDFDIRYIWYDQMCIDQDNPDEKRREIQQMHKIYGHAQCAVVLVPEFRISEKRSNFLYYEGMDGEYCRVPSHLSREVIAYPDIIEEAEWSKCIWTVEEALMSRRILFVGRDVHAWSSTNSDTDIPRPYLQSICTWSRNYTASTVLSLARKRTSSKPHDRVFALANLFPKIAEDFSFDYNQPLQTAMLDFYTRLVQADLSMLIFCATMAFERQETIKFRLPEEDQLPSWTGTKGIHIPKLSEDREHINNLSTFNLKCGAGLLHLSCNYVPVSIIKQDKKIPDIEYFASGPGILHMDPDYNSSLVFPDWDYGIQAIQCTHWLPITRGNDKTWINQPDTPTHVGARLSLTDTDCKECVILVGISYLHTEFGYRCMPVLKMDDDGYYSCIGTCFWNPNIKLAPSIERTKTFKIK